MDIALPKGWGFVYVLVRKRVFKPMADRQQQWTWAPRHSILATLLDTFLKMEWKLCSPIPLLHTSSSSCFTIGASSCPLNHLFISNVTPAPLSNIALLRVLSSVGHAFAQTFAEVLTVVASFQHNKHVVRSTPCHPASPCYGPTRFGIQAGSRARPQLPTSLFHSGMSPTATSLSSSLTWTIT